MLLSFIHVQFPSNLSAINFSFSFCAFTKKTLFSKCFIFNVTLSVSHKSLTIKDAPLIKRREKSFKCCCVVNRQRFVREDKNTYVNDEKEKCWWIIKCWYMLSVVDLNFLICFHLYFFESFPPPTPPQIKHEKYPHFHHRND